MFALLSHCFEHTQESDKQMRLHSSTECAHSTTTSGTGRRESEEGLLHSKKERKHEMHHRISRGQCRGRAKFLALKDRFPFPPALLKTSPGQKL